MDWIDAIGVGPLWAIGLGALAVGLVFALPGLEWCSLKSLWRLRGSLYVIERLALADEILCDGKGLYYLPRVESGLLALHFGTNGAQLTPGVFKPEECVQPIRQEFARRARALAVVVGALSAAWIMLVVASPGAASDLVAFANGSGAFSTGGGLFALLLVLSAFLLLHSFHPFSIRLASRNIRSSSRGAVRGGSDSAANAAKQHWPQSAQARAQKGPESFVGTEGTLSDVGRFLPLQRKALGAMHESVFVSLYCRSMARFHLRRFEDSLADIEQYAEAQRRALGKKNPWVLRARYLKAVNLAFLGKWPASLAEADALGPIQAEILGGAHADTLMTRSLRVAGWSAMERYADVVKEAAALAPEMERVLGANDQFTQSLAQMNAAALEKLDAARPDEDESAPAEAPSQQPAPAPPAQAKAATAPATQLKATPAPVAPAKARTPSNQVEAGRHTASSNPKVVRAVGQADPSAKRGEFALLAGAALVGVALLIGGGMVAGPWVWNRLAGSAPRSEEASPGAEQAAALSPSPLESGAAGSEEWLETPTAMSAATAPIVSMIAGRDGANVRSEPRVDAPLVVRLGAGSNLDVTERTEAAGHNWYRVTLPDRRSGFVREDVVVEIAAPAVEPYTPASPMAAGAAGANVRAAPKMDAPLVVRLGGGSNLQVTGRTEEAGRTWFRIVLPDRRVGFVRDDVVAGNTAGAGGIDEYTPRSPMAAGAAGAKVRSAPRIDAPQIVRLEAGSNLRVTGRTEAEAGHYWYRVVLPDGRTGFVRDDVVQGSD